MKIKKYIYLPFLLVGLSACGDDYLDTIYNSGVTEETIDNMQGNVPETLATGYLDGIYGFMASWNSTDSDAHDDLNYMGAMMVSNMTSQDVVPTRLHWFNYDYMFDNRMYNYRRTLTFWKTFYSMINNANKVIDVFNNNAESDNAKGLLGQAYAIRALSYLHLVQLYQKSNTADATIASLPAVPMLYAKAENKENKMGRNTVAEVRDQIDADLTQAASLLTNYERSVKYHIDYSVVKGFQARFYLLTGQWQKAADAAKEARTGYSLMQVVDDGFMNLSNGEWMWGFDHNAETQTSYASFFSHMSNLAAGYAGAGYSPKAIDAKLYSQISATDVRQAWFVAPQDGLNSSYYNLKFGSDGKWTMDFVYMRASEMILIEAEAYAHLGEEGKAATTLSELMAVRDPQWSATTATVEDVFLQRRIELWGEGFNYYDLKRLNIGVVRSYKGSNHTNKKDFEAGTADWTYQIPRNEMQENPEITENNP